MIRTGVFTIVNGESRLSDGTLLAVCSDPSPLVAARPFLLGRQCQQDHWVEVSGDFGPVDGITAFCMTDARPIAPPAAARAIAAIRPSAPVKAQSGKKKSATRKTAKKETAKKKSAKKRPAKGKKRSSAKTTKQRRKAKPARRRQSR